MQSPMSLSGNAPAGNASAGNAPEEEAPEAWVGRTIRGRYRVESVLGHGGMGTVFRVIHTGIDRPMALKLLSQKVMKHPNVIARFEQEARAMANFGHLHVAAATDYGCTEDGHFYLVMEYIEGKELRQAMDDAEGCFPPERALFIARQIARALRRAHKLGIVHRDLKPENIMLITQDGQDDFVKILDFGLALISRHLNSSEDGAESWTRAAPKLTEMDEIFGTPSYMAPEQTVCLTADIRTDLYALGVLLYEMLTGERPFVGKDPCAIMRQQLLVAPPPMKERAPAVRVPADIEALVMRLLAKQPSQRFQTPDELIEAIDRIGAQHGLFWPGIATASHTAVSIPAELPEKPRAEKLGRRLATVRTRVLITLGACLMLALLVGLLFHIHKAPEAPRSVLISSS